MLALRLLWRNWRSGEVRILSGALLLAVAVVTAISVFTNRLEIAIVKESATFLGADRVVNSSSEIPAEWLSTATDNNVEQAFTVEFVSMVFAGESMNLASVKAVSDNYPLLGKLEISEIPFAVDTKDISEANTVPAPGTAWVDSRLLPLLEAKLGEEIQVGDKQLTVTKILITEPDRGGGFAMVSPRLLMNRIDVAATNVIQPGSRVSYRWLLGGDNADLDELFVWLKPQLNDSYRLITLDNSQQQLASALDKGTRFLMLAGIVGVLLAGVAIAIAAQQFAKRHIDQVALMKSVGAGARRIRILYFVQLSVLAAFASLVGVVLGDIIQRAVAVTLSNLFPIALGSADLSAYGIGIFTGFVCLVFFALPPLWHLPSIPPLKILRRELPVQHLRTGLQGVLGAFAVLLLILFYSRSVWITITVFLSMISVIAVAAIVSWYMLKLGRRLGAKAGSVWRLALSSLQRNPVQSVVQVLVFSTAVMLLLALASVRISMLDEWQMNLPADAPNHIFLNIAPHEREEINNLLVENEMPEIVFSPMLRARLTHINGAEPSEELRKNNGVLRRELNVSWRETLANDNKIVSGKWWDELPRGETLQPDEEQRQTEEQRQDHDQLQNNAQPLNVIGGVSVERDVAKQLRVTLGDVLTFNVGGLEADVKVTSIRTVNRESFEWYLFLMEPGIFEQFQPSYRADLFLDKDKKLFVNELLLAHPTVVVFEFDKILEQIRTIVDQVSRGVELVLWLVIAGGFMVLLAAVNASMDNRLLEAGLLRALGSKRSLILGSVWIEFSVLGFCAGMLAVLGSEVLLAGLQFWVLDVVVKPHLLLWVGGILLGTITIGLLGVISCRRVVTAPPAVVLREIAA